MFRAIDRNQNHYVSHSEVKHYLHSQGWAQKLSQAADFHWKDLFSRYDLDGDGRLSSDEFGRLYSDTLLPGINPAPAPPTGLDQFVACFHAVDTEGVGMVKRDNLLQRLEHADGMLLGVEALF